MVMQKNSKVSSDSEVDSSRKWNRDDYFHLIVPIICIILVPLGGLPYLGGRLSDGFFSVIGFVLIPLFIIWRLFLSLIRLLIGFIKHSQKKRILIIYEIGICLIFWSLIFIFQISSWPIEEDNFNPIKLFAYGFKDRIESKLDIPATRAWLRTIKKEDIEGKNRINIYNNLPECIIRLNSDPSIRMDENGNPKIRLFWGCTGSA
jgi:hypothetical protein